MGYQHGPWVERIQLSKLGRTKPKIAKIACMVLSLTTNFLLITWANALGGREKNSSPIWVTSGKRQGTIYLLLKGAQGNSEPGENVTSLAAEAHCNNNDRFASVPFDRATICPQPKRDAGVGIHSQQRHCFLKVLSG